MPSPFSAYSEEELRVLRKKCQTKNYAPTSNDDFIEVMAAAGSIHTSIEGLPLASLIACAAGESGFGSSKIYQASGCPFNLQVPPCWKCELLADPAAIASCKAMTVTTRTLSNCLKDWKTITRPTNSKAGQKAAPVPFAAADSLVEAGRLWCEWIKKWPHPPTRNALLAFKGDAVAFATNLHRVGFADSNPAETKKFGGLVKSLKLEDYNATQVCTDVWGIYV